MEEHDYTRFVIEAQSKGQVLKPSDPGYVIAALAVKATPDLSGEFIAWDAERLRAYRA